MRQALLEQPLTEFDAGGEVAGCHQAVELVRSSTLLRGGLRVRQEVRYGPARPQGDLLQRAHGRPRSPLLDQVDRHACHLWIADLSQAQAGLLTCAAYSF